MFSLVKTFCARPEAQVSFDEKTGQLVDAFSKKGLKLERSNLVAVNELEGGQVRVVLGNSRFLLLTDAGVAFAPNFKNTPSLPQMPPAVVFRDFAELFKRASDGLKKPGQVDLQTVQAMLFSLAIVDGARDVGFDVAAEATQVEALLAELERRAPQGVAR